MNPRERKAAVEAELRALHEAAGAAALTDEQQTRWDELTTELGGEARDGNPATGVHLAIQRDDDRRAQVRAFADKPGHVESGDGATGAPKSPEFMRKVEPFDGADIRSLSRGAARDKALKALESRDLTGHLEQRQVDHMDRLLRKMSRNTDGSAIARRLLLTEDEHYRSAFVKLVTRTQPVLTVDEARAVERFDEYRAMSIGTDASGGFGVPVMVAA